jgi:DNA topoisomerase IB
MVDVDRSRDDFVRLTPEEVSCINNDPGSPFKVPPAAREVYVNRNRDSPRLAYWVFDSGNVGRVFTPEYRACRDGTKHDGVHELVENYEELLKKYEGCMAADGAAGEVCGIIYVIAQTGQRIGSRDGTASEEYRYEKAQKGRPRRVITGRVPTYGISTLRAKHVKIEGDSVMLDFTGKGGQRQSHVIENPVIAGFFRRLLRDKEPDEPVFSPHIYRTVYVKFKNDTGHTIKDLRTAMAHLLVPAAKEEWMAKNGQPATKTQERKMINYAVKSAASILGNKPAILKKSYANPDDLKPQLE